MSDCDKLPIGWCYILLGELGELARGKSKHRPRNDPRLFGDFVPFIQTGEVARSGGLICSFSKMYSEFGLQQSRIFPKGTICITIAANIADTGILKFDACFPDSVVGLITDETLANSYFVEYFLRTIREDLAQFAPATAQANINLEILNKVVILLPPLNEQRRIVAKIEALKARSQQVKEALEAIPPLLDQFRQSVLAAAFRGDLTADWREKNLAVDWETTTLEQVIKSKPRNGYSPKPVDYPTQVKSLTLSATTSGKFKSEYFKYIDETIPADSHLWLTPGDILIQRSNTLEYVGTCAIYDGSFGEFIYPDLIMKIQVKEERAIPKFIYYALSTKNSRQYFRNNATGTAGNMPKINQKVVMNTPIYLPTIEEQKEIVCCIESFLKAADQIAQQYREVKTYLELLDQSILTKAFRGELVSQDPNDEPVSILLERIRAERAKQETATKTAKKSTTKTSGKRRRKTQQQDSESVQLGLPGLE